jgi:C-terminal processing protease CtpA/Prc
MTPALAGDPYDYPSPPNLGAVQTLPVFLGAAGRLTLGQQRQIVDEALDLVQNVYVHLPLKRAIHAIDPVQRLRLLERRLTIGETPLKERRFHDEMIAIFTSLRDLHTNYILPEYFASHVAFLPFYLEEFFDDQASEQPRYVVIKLVPGFEHPQFKPGAVVKYWNGIPMDRAVELNADRNAGSNADARHARGLESMTIRPMMMSLPPDEEWVVLGYEADGQDLEIRLPWRVFSPDPQTGVARAPSGRSAAAQAVGMDFLTETVRRARVQIFVPDLADKKRALHAMRAYGATGRADTVIDPKTTSSMPDILGFREVTTPSGRFGYLRIFSFAPPDDQDASGFVDAFVAEVIRIIGRLPQNGLIVDVRGNGGGIIMAGELLLQLFTPRPIAPARFDFVNTLLIGQLTGTFDELKPWAASVAQAVETGSVYSQAYPLTPESDANALGQRYQGPVVLITDARCYSTTDIFAAGFQDHAIGPVLGAAGNTGAGGANVWDYGTLQAALPRVFKALPRGMSMRVAVRRCTRRAKMAGMPLEELGVVPDARHKMTRNDLFHDNVDLIAQAATLLKGQKVRTLSGTLEILAGDRRLLLKTQNVSRVDVYLNQRPTLTLDVKDGASKVDLPARPQALTGVYLEGFDADQLVATCRVPVPK